MDNIILEAHPEGPMEVSFKTVIKAVTQRNASRLVYQLKANVEELSTHKRKVYTFSNEYSLNSSFNYILQFIYICLWVIVLIDFHYFLSPP